MMDDTYLGVLAVDDPLYPFLRDDVLPAALGRHLPAPVFDVHALHPAHILLRYAERQSGIELAVKFYGNKIPPNQRVALDVRALLWQEFHNLQRVWQLGFDRPPHRVARPFAVNEALNYALVEEYVRGPKLDAVIQAAVTQGRCQDLMDRVGDLATFLATLHRRSATGRPVDPGPGLDYLHKVLGQLAQRAVISTDQHRRLVQLHMGWTAAPILQTAREVLIHGDATPVNFVLRDGGEVVAIDLERVRHGDPATDLGCVAAELRHTCAVLTGDLAAGEPFVQQLYHTYARHLDLPQAEYTELTARGRYWMGTTELRIARNGWLDLGYRRHLVEEAERCLAL